MPESNEPDKPVPSQPRIISDIAPLPSELKAPAAKPSSAPEVSETAPVAEALAEEPSVEEASDAPAETEAEAVTDPTTDQAVEDITREESDELLKVQDEAAEKAAVPPASRRERLKNFFRSLWTNPKRRYSILGAVVVVLVVLFAIPLTRYDILGVVLKKQVTVQVVDSKSGKAVSGALVSIGGRRVQTEANGKAVLSAHLGSRKIQVAKKYYRGYTGSGLVTLSAGHNTFKAPLLALGRQVQVTLVNKVTGKPLAGAVVQAAGAQAKTDKNGMAVMVVPSSASNQAATVTANGYNKASITIAVGATPAKNTFSVTPAGKLYFLSNLSGKIDVVKTNLDGTDRQTVLAGTGDEDPNDTSLLASRDWKYLVLLSRRDGNYASVYLIDTTNGDKLTTIDQGNASFSLDGWSGDNFVYQVTRSSVNDWQPNQQALKSYNAANGQALLLDQTQASGTSEADYMKQSFGAPYILGNQVVYAKNWQASYADWANLSGKQAELDSINADGTGHKVIKTFVPASGTDPANASYNISVQLYEPDGLYVYYSDNGQDSFYDYDDGTLSPDTKLTASTYYQSAYPTYLLSPSGNSTFWTEQRDGKNTLFTGDQDAKNQKQIATLSDYTPYGWYTDNYLLVSKGSSELYIMPASGGTPIKITDYYKPPISYNGYGGGYGGL